MFDMTQCKIGDKLVNRLGEVRQLSCIDNDVEPYKYMDTESRSYVADGRWWEDATSYEDIIGFWEEPLLESLQPADNPPSSTVRKEERYFITVNGEEVESTLSELRQLYGQLYDMLEGK